MNYHIFFVENYDQFIDIILSEGPLADLLEVYEHQTTRNIEPNNHYFKNVLNVIDVNTL